MSYLNPVDTRRRFNVYKTSILRLQRRTEFLQKLKRRRVSTGKDDVSCQNRVLLKTIFLKLLQNH